MGRSVRNECGVPQRSQLFRADSWRDSQDSTISQPVISSWHCLLYLFWPFGHSTGRFQDRHNLANLLSDLATEAIAGLLNFWPEFLPDAHEASFLLLREIQVPEVSNLVGQTIANQLPALRPQILERLLLSRGENAPNFRNLIASEVL